MMAERNLQCDWRKEIEWRGLEWLTVTEYNNGKCLNEKDISLNRMKLVSPYVSFIIPGSLIIESVL